MLRRRSRRRSSKGGGGTSEKVAGVNAPPPASSGGARHMLEPGEEDYPRHRHRKSKRSSQRSNKSDDGSARSDNGGRRSGGRRLSRNLTGSFKSVNSNSNGSSSLSSSSQGSRQGRSSNNTRSASQSFRREEQPPPAGDGAEGVDFSRLGSEGSAQSGDSPGTASTESETLSPSSSPIDKNLHLTSEEISSSLLCPPVSQERTGKGKGESKQARRKQQKAQQPVEKAPQTSPRRPPQRGLRRNHSASSLGSRGGSVCSRGSIGSRRSRGSFGSRVSPSSSIRSQSSRQSCLSERSNVLDVDDEQTIYRLESECTRLEMAMGKLRKYTQEWFYLETKLKNATEELDAAKEDRDLHFDVLGPGEDNYSLGGDTLSRAAIPGDDAKEKVVIDIPETLLLRHDSKKGKKSKAVQKDKDKGNAKEGKAKVDDSNENKQQLQQEEPKVDDSNESKHQLQQEQRPADVDQSERSQSQSQSVTSSVQERNMVRLKHKQVEEKLKKVRKFSPEWFQLKEDLVELSIALDDSSSCKSPAKSPRAKQQTVKQVESPGDRPKEISIVNSRHSPKESPESRGDFEERGRNKSHKESTNRRLEKQQQQRRQNGKAVPQFRPVPASPGSSRGSRAHRRRGTPISSPSSSRRGGRNTRSSLSPYHSSPPEGDASLPSSICLSPNYGQDASSRSCNSTSIYTPRKDDTDDESGVYDEDLIALKTQMSEASDRLKHLPQFSKEWFEVKAKMMRLAEQIDHLEDMLDNPSSSSTRRSGGLSMSQSSSTSMSSADDLVNRSSMSGWSSVLSESEEEIMSYADDLECVMVAEALQLAQQDEEDDRQGRGRDRGQRRDMYLFDESDSDSDEEYASTRLGDELPWERRQDDSEDEDDDLEDFVEERIMHDAAAKIQAQVRGWFQRDEYEYQRQKAIIAHIQRTMISVRRIQRAWRRSVFRQRMKAMLEQSRRDEIAKAEAIMETPAQEAGSSNAFDSMLDEFALLLADEDGDEYQNRQERQMAIAIQSWMRMMQCVIWYRSVLFAVGVIQRAWRGHRTRKQHTKKTMLEKLKEQEEEYAKEAAAAAEEERTSSDHSKMDSMLDDFALMLGDEADGELEVGKESYCAVMIEDTWTRHRECRPLIRLRRRAVQYQKYPVWVREEQEKQRNPGRMNAFAAMLKDRKRKILRDKRHSKWENFAAVMIQSLRRGSQVRRQKCHNLRFVKWCASSIQMFTRAKLQRCQYLRLQQSSIVVQSAVRMFQQHQRYSQIRQKSTASSSAAVVIQSMLRMKHHQCQFKTQRESSILIQSHLRKHWLANPKTNEVYTEPREVAFLSMALGIRLHRGRDGFVRVLSVQENTSIVRDGIIDTGDLVVEAAGIDMRSPITKDQWTQTVQWIRKFPRPMKFVVVSILDKCKFAMRIQRAWRRHSCLKHEAQARLEMLQASILIQCLVRRWLVQSSFAHKRGSIVQIQAVARSVSQKRRYSRALSSVILIQSVARGRLVRKNPPTSQESHTETQEAEQEPDSMIPTDQLEANIGKLSMKLMRLQQLTPEWYDAGEKLNAWQEELRLRRELESSLTPPRSPQQQPLDASEKKEEKEVQREEKAPGRLAAPSPGFMQEANKVWSKAMEKHVNESSPSAEHATQLPPRGTRAGGPSASPNNKFSSLRQNLERRSTTPIFPDANVQSSARSRPSSPTKRPTTPARSFFTSSHSQSVGDPLPQDNMVQSGDAVNTRTTIAPMSKLPVTVSHEHGEEDQEVENILSSSENKRTTASPPSIARSSPFLLLRQKLESNATAPIFPQDKVQSVAKDKQSRPTSPTKVPLPPPKPQHTQSLQRKMTTEESLEPQMNFASLRKNLETSSKPLFPNKEAKVAKNHLPGQLQHLQSPHAAPQAQAGEKWAPKDELRNMNVTKLRKNLEIDKNREVSKSSRPRKSKDHSPTLRKSRKEKKPLELTRQEKMQKLGIECVKLTKRMNSLQKGSPEWKMSKMEISLISEELQFLYNEARSHKNAERSTAQRYNEQIS